MSAPQSICLGLIVAILALGGLLAVVEGASGEPPREPNEHGARTYEVPSPSTRHGMTITEFQDQHGRVCTLARWVKDAALDCEYPPR